MASFPDWVEPMAATLTQERFTGPEWSSSASSTASACSRSSSGADVRLFSRNRLPQNLPPSPQAIASLPVHDVILDGEAHLGRRSGRLPRLRHPLARRPRRDVAAARRAPRAAGGAAAAAAAAARRRARRSEAVGARLPRRLGRRHREAARLALRAPPLAALAEDEVRGVAGARRRRLHRSAGRPRRPGRAARRLLRGRRLRLRRQGRHRLRHASCCSICARGSTRSRSRQPPFTKAVGLPRLRAHWVRPEIVVQVAFIEWTVHGKLRHPRLLGVRDDKAARDVVQGDAVITHPEKVLFPDDGITKGELAAYYEAIAPLMLPHIRGRPVTMERYPAGIGKKGFLQKDVSKGFPDWLERVEVPKKDGTVHHPLVTRHAVAALDGQPEHASRRTSGRRARRTCTIPTSASSISIRRETTSRTCCARRRSALRDLLDELGPAELGEDLGLEGLPHRRAARRQGRLRRRRAVRARASARVLVQRDPEHLTQEFSKADRGGRILVDTGRNGYSATFAAAYAVRAEAGRAGVGAVHVGGGRARRRSGRGRSRCGRWPAASPTSATCGPTCASAAARCEGRSRSCGR